MPVSNEGVVDAWNRWCKAQGLVQDGKTHWHRTPIRLRGYSEFFITSLSERERKYIDTSLRRGYTLSCNNYVAKILPLITQLCDFQIGYMGKSKGSLWFPTQDIRDRCMNLCKAQLVITDKFDTDDITAPKMNSRIGIRIPFTKGDAPKAYLKEVRLIVDEFMAEWAYPREVFADKVLQDDFVVRVPFDSKKDK